MAQSNPDPLTTDPVTTTLIEQLVVLEKKVNGISDRTATAAQNIIRFDLINQYQKEFNTAYPELTGHFDDKIKTLTSLQQDLIAKLQQLEQDQTGASTEPEAFKAKLQSLKDRIKSYKQELANTKKNLTAHKHEFSAIGKEIAAKRKKLQSVIKKIEALNREKQDSQAKINEQRHNLEYMQFPPLSENPATVQHKFIAGISTYKILNVDKALAQEITGALHLDSFNAILEELGYLLNTHPNRILMVYQSGLKFAYDLEVNENLRSFYASYNKPSKSWWLSPRESDYHTTQHLNGYISSRFNVVVDLDNRLLYVLKDVDMLGIIAERKAHPKIRLMQGTINLSKPDLLAMLSPCYLDQPEENPFNNERGISIYSPTSKQFEPLKKSTTIFTKLPELLFRFSTQGTYRFMKIDIQLQEINSDQHGSDQRFEILTYRNQLIDISENDFSMQDF